MLLVSHEIGDAGRRIQISYLFDSELEIVVNVLRYATCLT